MATKKYVSLSKLSTFLDNLKTKFATIIHTHKIADITDYEVDTTLSPTSTNPVQNKVIDAEFEAMAEGMNALELAIDGKANTIHAHDDTYYTENEIDEKIDAVNTSISSVTSGITTTGTGAAYTASVSTITSLATGVHFVMIPHTVSTSATPTLDVNGLGAKTIRRLVSNSTTSTAAGYNNSWLAAGKPIRVTYNGTFWIVDLTKPSAADMNGTLGVSNGGTGRSSVTAGSFLVGNGTSAMTEKTPAEAITALGITATAAELNYMDGVTSNVQTQIDTANANITKKVSDMTLEIYNGTSGNPKPVKFATVNYSTCGSENGVAIKVSMVSGHGNGSSYAFLQDTIIKVTHAGVVEVDNFKYYGASAGTYDGADRQYGDIFWVIDTTNKIVDFYCLMGQYARMYQSPFKRVTYSTGGTITQHTSCTVYSSGTKVYGNNSNIALMSDIDSLSSEIANLKASIVTVHSGTEAAMTSSVGSDGDVYLVTK